VIKAVNVYELLEIVVSVEAASRRLTDELREGHITKGAFREELERLLDRVIAAGARTRAAKLDAETRAATLAGATGGGAAWLSAAGARRALRRVDELEGVLRKAIGLLDPPPKAAAYRQAG
jgi:hypothetical protein